MKRLIFQDAKPITEKAKSVIETIFKYDSIRPPYYIEELRGITEDNLSYVYRIPRRRVRRIVEAYNFNKWLGIDSTQKIKVINGRYRIVKDELVAQVAQYHLDNFHEYIQKGKIMAKALGNVAQMNEMFNEIMEEE